MKGLKVENVTYSYGGPDILREVSCTFEYGKIHAIAGKSGSGKTTLLSLLAGLDLPKEGDILYDGVSIKEMDLSRYRREKAAVIYQSFRLFPLMNAFENIMYPMELKGINGKEALNKAKDFLAQVDLEEKLGTHFPNMLSGGEQQRVAIARALATDAKLILADEPTGNLDRQNSDNIISILRQLAHQKGYCVIVVTHDFNVLDSLDVVYHMEDGYIGS